MKKFLSILFLFSILFTSICFAKDYEDLTDNTFKSVKRYVDSKSSKMDIGVGFYHIETGKSFYIKPNEKFPLASVFKVPIMICVLQDIDKGKLALSDKLSLNRNDQCVGSGDIQYSPLGQSFTASNLMYKMISVSDNTASDMLWNYIGYDACNDMLKNIGLNNSDVYIANRPSWLLSLGEYSKFRNYDSLKIASVWKNMNKSERFSAIQEVLNENSNLTLSQFQKIEDDSENTGSYESDVVVAEALDNLSTPRDFSILLAKLYKGELLSKPMTNKALAYMGSCKYNSRIPGKLPSGTKVWHKTGTIAGCVNDVGIVKFSDNSHGVVVVFARRVKKGYSSEAGNSIADISKIIYDNFSK